MHRADLERGATFGAAFGAAFRGRAVFALDAAQVETFFWVIIYMTPSHGKRGYTPHMPSHSFPNRFPCGRSLRAAFAAISSSNFTSFNGWREPCR